MRSSASAEEQRANLASIVESSYDPIISKDLRGTILSWNPAARRVFGYSEREIVGRPITVLIPPDRQHEEKRILARIRRGEKVDHYETVRRRKDGTLIDVSITVSPIRDASGRIVGASKIVRDITEQHRAEAALRESERRMRAVLDSAVDSIITIDERGTMESLNPATERLFGYSASELIGRNVKMLMPEPYHSEHDGYLQNYLRTGRPRIIGIGREVTALRKDGSTFPMSLSVSEVPLGSRRLFTGIVHDLSGRRQLERQIVDASTEEQRRIGQDLHDGLCQDLIGIAFQADSAARKLAAHAPTQAQAIDKLAASIRDAAVQARRLSHGLNPVDLKSGGLPVALEALAVKVSESFNVSCTFRCDGGLQVQDDATATHLYRIAQEAVSNAIKHGKSKRIEILLTSNGGRLALCIKDNGVGLPQFIREGLSTAPPTGASDMSTSRPGIGLHTMHYRANMIGGSFDIRPGRRGGVVVTCSINGQLSPLREGVKRNGRPSGKSRSGQRGRPR